MINEDQRDILSELLNVGVGDAARSLNYMIHHHVKLKTPIVEETSVSKLKESLINDLGSQLSSVHLHFSGDLLGDCFFLLSPECEDELIGMITNGETLDQDQRKSVIEEIGNILLNSVMASFANMMQKNFKYQVPIYRSSDLNNLESDYNLFNTEFVLAQVDLEAIDTNVTGKIFVIMSEKCAGKVASCIHETELV